MSKYLVQVLHFTIVLVLAAQFSFSWLARWRSPASGESACAKHHGLRPDLLRISTPLIYAALGGLLTYQAGILNIALDGFHDRRGLCRDRRRLRQRKRRARGDRRNRQRHGACRAPRRL